MAEFLTLTIGEETFRFHTRNQLIDWWGKERTHWQWLWESTGRREFNSTRDIANQLNATIATADPSELVEDLERFFRVLVPVRPTATRLRAAGAKCFSPGWSRSSGRHARR